MNLTSSVKDRVLIAVALAAAIICQSASALAQGTVDDRPNTWGVIASAENLTGGFSGGFHPGIALGALAHFPLAARRLALRADIIFHALDSNHGICGFTCSHQFDPALVVSGTFGLVARLNDASVRWSPYLIGGVAAYIPDPAHFSYNRTNHFGLQGGVGFEYHPNKHTYFVEMRYLGMPPGGIVPVTVGMRF